MLLRRALIAVELGDLEAASAHAEASGTPAGALIRAEILLGEADPDAATELLTPLTEQKGGLAGGRGELSTLSQRRGSLGGRSR